MFTSGLFLQVSQCRLAGDVAPNERGSIACQVPCAHRVRGALCRQSSRRDGQPQRGPEMLLINTEIYAAYKIHSQ